MIGAKAGTKLGGYPGVPQPSAQQAQQAQHQQGKQQDWAQTLEANSAGAATNAEDFTKQFMSDMFGGGAGILDNLLCFPPTPFIIMGEFGTKLLISKKILQLSKGTFCVKRTQLVCCPGSIAL